MLRLISCSISQLGMNIFYLKMNIVYQISVMVWFPQDHYFDVVTNVVGLAAAVLGDRFYWWIDPIGAIALAVYTISNWSGTVWENAGLCYLFSLNICLRNRTRTYFFMKENYLHSLHPSNRTHDK